MRRFVSASLALGLAACSGGPEARGPDAGSLELEAFFGLQIGRCLEYSALDARQEAPDLGLLIRTLQNPEATHELVYRQGPHSMTDWVVLADGELRLRKRALPDGREILYDPPLVLLRAPVRGGSVVESRARAIVYRNGVPDPPAEHALRVDVLTASEVGLPMGVRVTGHLVAFAETPSPGRSETRTFVPGTGQASAPEGWVVVEFNFGLDDQRAPVAYKLQAVRLLGPDPSTEEIPCGAAP